jgi:hypothetical protein
MTHTPTDLPPRAPKPRRHLMTPGEVRPQPARTMSLTSVQRWVMSTLLVSTGLHLAGGVVLGAHYADERSSAIGLLVISGAFGLLSVAAGLMIHRAKLLHPLLLLGLLPPLLGTWWTFG